MNNLPRAMLVALGLVGGLILIYLVTPPFTACTAQYEVIQKSLTPYLYLDPRKKHIVKTGMQKSVEDCKLTNNSGGCFPFFEGSQKMVHELRVVSPECAAEVLEKSEIKSALFQSTRFMVALAWGAAPPKSEFERDGWYDNLNKAIFCELKTFLQNNFKDDWASFIDETLQSLPGSNELQGPKGWREATWNRTILANRCDF